MSGDTPDDLLEVLDANETSARAEVGEALAALRGYLDSEDDAISVSSLRGASERAASAIAARNQATLQLKMCLRIKAQRGES